MTGQQDLVNLAVSSGLIDADRAAACRAQAGNVEAAFELLVAQRLLTRWQAAQLKAGRAQGFFLGRYKLLEPLEHTTAGNVYRAVDPQAAGRQVALLPLAAAAAAPAALERLNQEAAKLRSLQHEGIARLLEVGRQGEQYFLVYELAPGGTLAKYLAQHGRLPLSGAARAGHEIAAALEHARLQGVVHGQLDPTTVWLTGEHRIKLAGLGLAACQQRQAQPAAKAAAVDPQDYRPPEWSDPRRPLDTRGDVYALGCLLYRCLAGEPPFAQTPTAQKAAAHAQTAVPSLAERCPDVPLPVAELIERRLLAKRPEDRPPSLAVVAGQLAAFVGSAPAPQAYGDPLASLLAMDAAAPTVHLPSGMLPHKEITKTAGRRAAGQTDEPQGILGNLKDSHPWLLPVGIVGAFMLVLAGAGYLLKLKYDGTVKVPQRGADLPAPAAQAALPSVPTAQAAQAAPAPPVGVKKIVAAGAFAGHQGTAESVAISPDGSFAISGGGDATLRVWNVETGEETGRLHGHEGRINTVAISPAGDMAVSGGGQIAATDDGSVRIWDLKTNRQIAIIDSFRGNVRESIREVTFSPDGLRVLSGHTAARLLLSGARSGRMLQAFGGHTHDLRAVTFKPNGQEFASSSDDLTIRIWSPDKAQSIRTIDAGQIVHILKFLPDNKRMLAGGNDGSVRLWDTDAGSEIKSFLGHRGGVYALAITSDGLRAISGGGDGALILWDIETGARLQTMTAHTKAVRAVSISRDNTRLVSCSIDGSVKSWTLE